MAVVYLVRSSMVHGKGVFARQDLAKGQRIIEYKGELISNEEADARHPWNPAEPFHTFYFSLDDGAHCIDGGRLGNVARWINHSCGANCETEEVHDPRLGRSRVYIFAKCIIKAGQELNYDYRLDLGSKVTRQDQRNYQCRCGSKKCRGTMLALPSV